MPAARWARPCSSGTSCSSKPRRRAATIPAGQLARPGASQSDEIEPVPGSQPRRPITHLPTEDELLEHTAELLADEKIVGWFQGRMEFGPRALGARSILGDPRSPRMQAMMNVKIKFRESFRPFAPAVLQEHAADWFDMRARPGKPVHAAGRAGADEPPRADPCRADRSVMTRDPDLRRRVNVVAFDDPGRHARRLQRPPADRRCRAQSALSSAAAKPSTS